MRQGTVEVRFHRSRRWQITGRGHMQKLKTYVRSKYPRFYSWLGIAKYFAKHRETKRATHDNRARIFSEVYRKNVWGESETRSGSGSGLEQTSMIREKLPALVKSLGARSLLDLPCGDLHWIKRVDLGIDAYIGGDIVRDLIEQNRESYGDPKRTFLVFDVTKEKLPKLDLILCRDCLGHLSFKDIQSAVWNFVRSESTYLLTTTFPKLDVNRDIRTGGWRRVNLQNPLFNFPEPVEFINEGCTERDGAYADKSLGLWKLSTIRRPRRFRLWEYFPLLLARVSRSGVRFGLVDFVEARVV